MTHVVTENCLDCVYTDCVEVCPVDCFYRVSLETKEDGTQAEMLVIDDKDCIDCGVCVSECPVEAIYPQEDLPEEQLRFLSLNAQLAPKGKNITRREPAHVQAEEWRHVPNKRTRLVLWDEELSKDTE